MSSRRALGLAITLGLAAGGVGCAPSLSTFQPAHVLPKGHLAVSGGFEAGFPVSGVTTLVDVGKAVAKRGQNGENLNDDEKWQIFDAGVKLVLETPSIGPHFAANYSVIDRLELGVRYAGSAWRAGVRYQVLDHVRYPVDFTVGVGVSRFTYTFPISDQIPVLRLDDFSRWQIDVPILVGTSGDWYRLWVGPKLLYTAFSTQLTLTLPSDTTLATFDGTALFVGGQGGIALGYRHLFLAFELTLVECFGTAHLNASLLNPTTHDTNLSTFEIFPSIGLMGEI